MITMQSVTYRYFNYLLFAAVVGGGAVLFFAEPASAASLLNPLGTDDPTVVVSRIIRSILGIVGVIALLVIIYGGFEMLTSGGNQDRITRGRDAILWAFIGLLVIFGSYGILQAVFQILSGDPLF
jgi:hypothetical protein